MPEGSKKKQTKALASSVSTPSAIAKYLENAIVSGNMQPGQRLDEGALGKKFGVSRTPVREALLQLSASDLIEFRPRQSAIVAAMPLTRILQMSEVMAELESLCARLSAERMTIAERKLMRNAAEACTRWAAKANSETASTRYFEANTAFHQSLYEGAHNDYLAEATFNLRRRLSPFRRFALRSVARLKSSNLEHGQIVDAILAGESERAGAAMRIHITLQASVLANIDSLVRPASEKLQEL